ncbi:hypothetical protein P152DRAFT_87677 [Eremomyces bilateralis CBS 781.70]|uniref:Uncharacterized protein n=1 Tax=Eremomyces bilateralis CBS 781.70 TaxID=1392243 RepID=A0A6G1FYW6_9PEZI|nr:uncharacterized protein P152DRAFT_87677 [Eremomyces bilateralis CBS 781.70]KAF1810912.1 hypothetical protein P152DRAFT_87677 [Eremomyces bilateralis CBS 781.70]
MMSDGGDGVAGWWLHEAILAHLKFLFSPSDTGNSYYPHITYRKTLTLPYLTYLTNTAQPPDYMDDDVNDDGTEWKWNGRGWIIQPLTATLLLAPFYLSLLLQWKSSNWSF